jgi:hypothetical protein
MRNQTDKGPATRAIGKARLLGCATVVALAATGCAGDPRGERDRAGSPQAATFAGVMARIFGFDPPAEPDGPETTVRQASRSIWGVVPDPPRRKADLRPELIKGSAVAIAGDTLLASCRIIGERRQVGLVRHNKYYRGQVVGAGSDGQICILRARQAPLQATSGFRSFADLRAGEPIIAMVNRTSAELALAPGWLAAKGRDGSSDPVLETTLTLPPETLSAVLFDARGNLIGLGSAGPVAESMVLGVPVTASLAPQLARYDLGASQALLASLEPAPRERPRPPMILLRADRDNGGPSTAVATAGGTRASGSRAGDGRGGVASGGSSSGRASGTDVHGGADNDRAAGAGNQGRDRGGGQGQQDDDGGSGQGRAGNGGDGHGGRGRGGDHGHGGHGRGDGHGGDSGRGGDHGHEGHGHEGHGRGGGHGGDSGRGGGGNSGRGGRDG